MADFHARAVNEHPGAELVAAANWRPQSLQRLAARHGIPAVTGDWRSLAVSPEVDAAVIATPNALHAPQAIAFLEAGKHVLVEKPMAASVDQGELMLEAASRGGGALMVGHCWRFHPEVTALRERIARGELGAVVKTRGYGVHTRWGPAGWFTDPELSGGGALMDMGVHGIDTARFLLGGPDPVRVCAAIGTRYGSYTVDDDGILLIGWSNGVNSVVESGWWQPHAGGLEADTEVYGTGGFARVWDYTEPPSDDYEHCTQPMFSAQMAEFVHAVSSGRPPRPGGQDGLVVMRIVEEAYRSAAVVRA